MKENQNSNQIPYTIRFPEKLLNDIKKESEKIGCSFNSYVLLMIDAGRKKTTQD